MTSRPRAHAALIALATLAIATPSLAGLSAPGVNLRWDQCYADGGAWNKTFACNTNLGTDLLVGTFELTQPLTQVVSAQIVLDVRSASSSLPAWWLFPYSGGCRSRSMDFQPVGYPSSGACSFDGIGAGGGLSGYSIGLQGPSHVRLTGAFAARTVQPVDLVAGAEYYAFTVFIDHAKTVGTGSCGGCDVPVCAFLSRISLYQRNSSTAAIHLERGANWLGSQYVTWQNGYPVDVHHECDPAEPHCARQYTAFGCVLATATSSRKSTWGAVKALYK